MAKEAADKQKAAKPGGKQSKPSLAAQEKAAKPKKTPKPAEAAVAEKELPKEEKAQSRAASAGRSTAQIPQEVFTASSCHAGRFETGTKP